MGTDNGGRRHPEQVANWNATDREFSAQSSIIDLLDAAAAKHGDAPAVRTAAGVAITHGSLAVKSSLLARKICAHGVRPRTPVALLIDHSPEAVTVIHAVVRSGAFYVPLDPRWPVRRMKEVLRSIKAEYLIATDRYVRQAIEIADAFSVISVGPDECALVYDGARKTPRSVVHPSAPLPEDLAYTIFTSGSTGRPKAVAIRHVSVVNLIEWFNRRNEILSSDILLQVSAFSFDLSVYDIFGVLAAGASILMIPSDELQEPEDVANALLEYGVTLWNSAPALFTAVTHFLDESSLHLRAALRRVFLSGDWIPLATPRILHEQFPNAVLISLGGATEACVWSNDFPVVENDPTWRSIPYGNPMQNCHYYVLREDLTPCEIGEPGELYIGGVCVAAGYLNDPVLTAERFLPDPWRNGEFSMMYRTGDKARWTSNGWVEFLGRLDLQVKVRGFRIELGEIEHAATKIPDVDEAVAIAAGDRREPFLALALRSAKSVDVAVAKAILREWLPGYMCPERIAVFTSFPVGMTGKVDRAELRRLFTAGLKSI